MACTPYGYASTLDEDAVLRREALVLEHMPQVRLIARRMHRRMPSHISLDDLVSAGVLGLLSAIDNFNPSFEVQLKTYADRKIRGAILESLRELDWAPRETRKKYKLIAAGIRRAEQRAGRAPTEEEIAEEMRLSLAEYQQWLGEVQSIELERLEYAPGESEGGKLLRVISDDPEEWPSQIVERSELERILALAIERMPKIERTVLSLYYYEELNLREIGEVMGMHLSRIGQMRAQAILRLRTHLERVWMCKPGEGV